MLVKLAPVVNFTNNLRAAFVPIFFCQKITKSDCEHIYTLKNTFVWKSCYLNVGEIDTCILSFSLAISPFNSEMMDWYCDTWYCTSKTFLRTCKQNLILIIDWCWMLNQSSTSYVLLNVITLITLTKANHKINFFQSSEVNTSEIRY
jgi:hypothetical protein